METKNLQSMKQLNRRGNGANRYLFRYAAMVAVLLMLGIGNAWGSSNYYASLQINQSGPTGAGSVYVANSNTKPGSANAGTAVKSAATTTKNGNVTMYWWVGINPGYNVTLSGKVTGGPYSAASANGNVSCAASGTANGTQAYTATATFVAVTVDKVNNSTSNTSLALDPTNPSTDYPFTVTFATSNLKTIALDLNKSPETTDGKFTITGWSLDGANVVASGKFNGGGTYGGASRNNSTTVSLQSKASGSAAKTCTVTANFPAMAFVSVSADDVYASQGESGKTGSATFKYNYAAEDDFPTTPTLTPTSGTGTFTVTGYTVTPDFAKGETTVTVNYSFDTNNGIGETPATLTLTAANGDVRTVTVTGHSEAAAINDVSVTTAAGVTTEYATWAAGLTAANASAGSTLKLLRDIDLTGTYGITSAQGITQTITLDLNGKTLSGAINGSILNPKTAGKTLTIKDSKTGGRIQNITPDYDGITYGVNISAGTVNLESGTIYAENQKQYNYGTSSVGGTASNTAAVEVRAVRLVAGAKFNMSGGKVEAHGTRAVRAIYQESSKANTTEVNISGGEVYAEAPSYVYGILAYGKVNISGTAQINVKINDGLVNGNATYQSSKFDSYTLHRYGYAIYMTASASKTPSACYFGTLTMTGGTINVENVNKTLNGTSLNTEHTYGVYMNISSTGMGNANGEATDGTNTQKASSIGSIENATINVTHEGVQVYGVYVLGCYNSFNNTTTPFSIKNSTINVTGWQTVYGALADVSIDWSNSLTTYTGTGRCSAGNIELTNTTINATTTGGTGAYCAWASATYGTVADAKANTGARSTGNATYKGEYAVAATLTVNSGTYTASAATSSAYAVGSSDRAITIRNIRGSISNRDAVEDPVGSLGGNAEAYPELNIHGGNFSATTGTTTAIAVKSGGNTLIDGGTFNAYAGGSTAYGLYVTAGKTVANGVTFPASATTKAYGVYVTGGISDWSLFTYYGDVELNNCNATATARTTTDARGVFAEGNTKVYTQASFDAMKTANNSNYTNYGDYAQVGERAFVAKVTINGGTYSATAETTTAYGIIMTSTRVSTNKEAIAYNPLVVRNATVTAKTNTGTTAYGVQIGGGGLVENCTISATAGTTTASGVRAIDKTTVIKNSTISAKGTDAVYGLEGYVDASTAHGYCWHGDFDLSEAGTTKVTAESTGATKAYTIYLNAKAVNVASGAFAGDYATAANATINGGTYIAKTNGGTSGYTLALTGTQTKGTASAQPEVLIEGGKFNGATAEVGTAGVAGHVQLKGGYYVHNTNLAKYIPEGYEEVPLASDRPEYTEGYRYEVAEEGFHGIDVCKIGSTKYKSLEEALQVVKSGETIIMIANYIMATPGDYILPSGAKLLVPYSGQTATKETNLEYVEGTSAATLNLKLTFGEGVHLVSQGVIECGAKQTGQGSSELTGQVYGSYGHIYLREGSSITVESGASLYAWGYVTGKGEIILKNGGKSYEMFQFGWYKGGNTTSDINSNKSSYKIFPMTDYSYQNIECPITYYPGSSAYGRVAVKPSSYSSMQTPSAMLVGTADNSMFKMTTAEASANTWVKKVYDPETDITNWIMNSGASISGISMNVGVNVNSADFYLPITSNFRITLNYGEMNINNDVIFLPGSQLIINKEATGILKSGKLLFFYDAEDWFTGLGHVSVQASGWSKAKTCGYYYYPATYSPTWGTTNPRKSVYARDKASLDKGVTPLPDAELFVHGKMIVNGSLYTSGDGNASSIGRNANIHSTNEDAGKIQFNTKVTGSKALYKVCFAIGASEANNSWSDMIYGGQTTAYPAHLTNGDGTYVQSSGTEAGKQYVYVDNQWQCWEENGCYTYDAQNHPYAKPAAYVQLTSDQPDANHLLHDAATGTRNFVWDADCYWWEVVTTPTAEGYYQSINPDYNGKYNYYYYDGSAACWKIKKITITWNINGTTTNYSVGYGTKPEWLGATPTKTSSSSDYVWRWDGWTKGSDATVIANNDLPFVTENTTFTAHFYEKYYEYNITFKNSDGTILDSRNWRAGTTPSYEGTPTKNPTAAETYEFNGTWSPAITKVTGSATYTAQYTATPRAYTITFLNYDMSVLGTAEVVYNGTPSNATYLAAVAPMTEDPYKPDNSAYSFEFAGWRLQGASSNGFAQVKGDQTYVAQFNQTTKKYKVSFVDDDGETVLHYLQLEYGQTPSYTWANPSKQDAEWTYSFTGWTPATFSEVQGPQTYVANYNKTKREYTITWKDGDGNTLTTSQVAYGETPAYSGATPTKTSTSSHSYVFNNTWSPAIVAVTGEATYTAQFNETERKYRVTWDAATNGGTCATEYSDFSYNAAIGTLPVATKEGHTFNGWFTSATGGTKITTATKVTADVTYRAQFTVNPYTITFDSNGGSSVASITQNYGTAVTAPADPTREGYTFNGWSPVVPSTMPVNGLTCVAQWTVNPYTITFNSNGGSSVASITQNYGTAVTAPADPTREGYTFAGWSPAVPSTMPVNGLTCVAQWNVNPYTISFNSNGGSSVASITQNYGTAVTAPADPTREGYTFNGWNPAVPSTMPVNGLTCVAQWTVNPYTITFNSNGGSSVASITQNYGTAVTAPADPTREGYTFNGWSPAVPSTMPVNGLTCVAQWTVNSYTVTLHTNEGTINSGNVTSYTYGIGATLPNNVTRANHIFEGWYANSDLSTGGVVTAIGISETGDKEFWAKWKLNNFDVTFDVQGHGTAPAAQSIVANGKVTKPADPSETGWTFNGWYKEEGCTNAWNFSSDEVTANTILYAKWTRTKYTIKWVVKLNGETEIEETEEVEYGVTPDYGPAPTKETDAQYEYSFTKWSPAPYAADKDQTYEGTFTAKARLYTITWYDAQSTLDPEGEGIGHNTIKTEQLTYGQIPSFTYEKPDSEGYTYTVTGWIPEVVAVSGDATYTAVYTARIAVKEVSTNESLSFDEDAETTKVHACGQLNTNGHTLTTTTLILEAEVSASGQIADGSNINVSGNVYFDLKLNTPARHWHAFGVPWAVNLSDNPLTEVETGRTLTLGKQYEIVYYDTYTRATEGPGSHCWKYLKHYDQAGQPIDELAAGKGYMIAFTIPVQTVRFVKKSGAPIFFDGSNSVIGGEGDNGGWNAIANPMAYHATLNAGPTVGYVHDGGEIGSDGYVPYNINGTRYIVGKTVYVQAGSDQTIVVNPAGEAGDMTVALAPKHRANATGKQYLSLSDYYTVSLVNANGEGSKVYVLPEDDKADQYVIGHDLSQFSMSSKKAQIWIDRYDNKLALNTTAPIGDVADFPVSLYAPAAGEYTIDMVAQPDEEYTVYLTQDGEAVWNLSGAPYSLTLNKGTTKAYGVRLSRKAPQIATGIDEAVVDAKGETRKVLINDKVFIIRGDQVYSADGQLVK